MGSQSPFFFFWPPKKKGKYTKYTPTDNTTSIGGTGHVGGAVLDKLLAQHAAAVASGDLQVRVLARSEDKAARLRDQYPTAPVQTLVGDLADYALLRAASRDADVVVNAAPDITHDDGIRAVLAGLEERRTEKQKPAYYIHTSGASLIWDEPAGAADARLWDDVADVAELSALEEKHTHAVTDKIVREAATTTADINVAIVSPGFVGGLGPSREHPTPITTPAILTTARAFNSGFQIAPGLNQSAWIHVLDLADIYLLLVADALAAIAGTKTATAAAPGKFPLWGPEAYYFGVAENIPFRDFMKALAPVLKAQGVIADDKIQSVSVKDAARISLAGPGGEYDPDAPAPPPDSWAMHISVMYGINMRLKSSRLEALGWKPKMGTMVDTFNDVVAEFLRREKLAA